MATFHMLLGNPQRHVLLKLQSRMMEIKRHLSFHLASIPSQFLLTPSRSRKYHTSQLSRPAYFSLRRRSRYPHLPARGKVMVFFDSGTRFSPNQVLNHSVLLG